MKPLWHRWWAFYHDFSLWLAAQNHHPAGVQIRHARKHLHHLTQYLKTP